jgi:excinuclease ABC subunit C
VAVAPVIPERLQDRVRSLPDRPGVYLFKERSGTPVYIGKAVSLRKRVGSHFRSFGEGFTKAGVMLSKIHTIDFIETPTEAEALLLEASLVKEAMPRYNVELRDDKSYPFLKITAEEYPRLLIARSRRADGAKYFGPYTSSKLLKQAVKMLRRQFPLRTCRKLPKKVCLLYHIGQCGGPCEGMQEKSSYAATVKELERFLEGRRDALVRTLTRRMREHAAKRQYEQAQALFEEIKALSTVPLTGRGRQDAAHVLKQLQAALALPRYPARIEGFDISNIQGSEAVGSMVVFVDGRPARSEYRRFRVRTVEGIDDYRMMQEVVRRRYSRLLEEKRPLPDLVLIDGGKGHLSAAKAVLDELGLTDQPVVSIAKEHEYLFTPHREGPYIFPQSSPFLELVRHLRDEAHRFAITYHRHLHKKEALVSLLDGVPGVGPTTKRRLLTRVGSVRTIRRQTAEALAEKAGVRLELAQRILHALRQAGDEPQPEESTHGTQAI